MGDYFIERYKENKLYTSWARLEEGELYKFHIIDRDR